MYNKNLKDMFDKEFNVKNMKEEILLKEAKKEKKNLLKLTLVPICLVLVLVGIHFVNNKDSESEVEPSNTVIEADIKINDMSGDSKILSSLDMDIKVVEAEANYDELKDIALPSDLENKESYAIYINGDLKEYEILNNYVLSYSNSDESRNITISFSKEHEILKDYYLEVENTEVSVIANTEVKIYKNNEEYYAEFKYNNVNYDIETRNIVEEEVISLLKSIIN